MFRRLTVLVALAAIVAALLAVPGVALAQTALTDQEGFVLQVNRPTVIGANEIIDGVVGISGDVLIDGVVTGTLWVFDGTATVNGRVNGDIMVVDGVLNLGPTANVQNVSLIRGTLHRDAGATVTGTLNQQSEFIHFGWGGAVFSILVWAAMTLLVVLAGFAFVALGRAQLAGAGSLVTGRPLESVLAALAVWVGLPFLAVLAMVTLIGIPVGIALLVVVLPTLWVLGYLVVSAKLGAELLRLTGRTDGEARPYLTMVAGLLVVQIAGLIPFIGGLAIFLAGFVGSGTLVYRVFQDRTRRQPAAVGQLTATRAT